MKRYLLTVCSLVYAFVVFAGSVTENQALAKACQFMPGKSFVFVRTAESGKMNSSGNVPYYIFNAENNGGFVIVSGDDRTKAILGYSESGSLKGNDLPENVESWLNYYAEAISSLEDSSPNVRYVNATSAKRSDISPLITTKWSQRTPYNDQCVFDGLGSCVTGCVATAFAQVLNYYQYPNKVAAMDKYTRNGTDTIPALPGATLVWKNMCATYNQWEGNRTDAQKKAVATLMRYCGQSVLMNYGPYSSGGKDWTIPTALKQYFGYDDCAQCIYRSNYSVEDWENTIYQELSGKHPIIYTGFTTAGGGHCFVVDGYKKKDSTYHVNWGWGGSCDGYFVLTVMNASESSVYDQNQRAIIGVRPLEGKVKLSKSKVTLEAGKTLTLKPTVSPEKLLDKSVTWKSSDKKVATVTSKGKVTAVKAGTATITCTSAVTGAKATCKVTVGSVSLDKSKVSVKKGKTVTLKATVAPSSLKDKSVTWESSDTKVATVTSEGKVKGVRYGTATITCTSKATDLKATCKVTVGKVVLNESNVSIKKGKTVTLTATVYPTTLSDKSVTWKSSNTKVATVTTTGKVKGVKAGSATITCTSNATGLSTTCKVTVGYVKLDQTEVTVKKGKTVTLKATVYPSSLEDKSVTWESSDTKIATVTSKGKVKGIKAGTATITCTSVATGLSTTCTVTVKKSSSTRSIEGDEEDNEVTGIEEEIIDDPVIVEPFDVYDLSGHKVLNQVTSLDGLPDGIYIVNGKKVLKK